MFRAAGAALAAGLLGAAPAHAAEIYGGLFKHDLTAVGNFVGLGAAGREHGVDVHLGVRSNRLENLAVLGRPQLGPADYQRAAAHVQALVLRGCGL